MSLYCTINEFLENRQLHEITLNLYYFAPIRSSQTTILVFFMKCHIRREQSLKFDVLLASQTRIEPHRFSRSQILHLEFFASGAEGLSLYHHGSIPVVSTFA